MKKILGITLLSLLLSLGISVNGFCNNNEWDPTTQTLTLRGINIAGNTNPDQLSVFAEMKLVTADTAQLRFKVTRVDWDSEKDEGTYYPDTKKVNFTIEIDSVNYNVWMVMSRDSQGAYYFVLQTIEQELYEEK